jgi:sec-independent protein translocase protein TatA
MPGLPELLVVLVVILLVFGPKRLPALGRQLGGGFREFKDSITKKSEGSDEDDGDAPAEVVPAKPELTRAEPVDEPATRPGG